MSTLKCSITYLQLSLVCPSHFVFNSFHDHLQVCMQVICSDKKYQETFYYSFNAAASSFI
jgi:hypothetical protein